jgi:hypothetical protein
MQRQYYVQSGTLRVVVAAENRRKAALWAVHQAMNQILPVEDNQTEPQEKSEACATAGVQVLGREILVSDRGFDRPDARSLATIEIVSDWNQMISTLDRLERLLHQAA